MVEIIWSKRALDSLEVIFRRIAEDSPEVADKFIRTLIAKINLLEHLRESGRIVPELQNPSIRELFHKKYRIIYQINENTIEILTVIYGARQLHF